LVPGFESLAVASHPLQPDSMFPYNKMPDVDLANRHPALQSMCSKD